MQHRIKTALTFAAVALAIHVLTARSANAELLVHEPFAYADGGLTGQGGALGTTGTWTANETHTGDWRVHQEGDTAGIVVDPGPPIVRGMFDGTVNNLATSGGYVGLHGPDDTGADPDSDHEIGRNMDASIALAPSVTASFQTGTTTWISYVSARAWDRNEEHPNLVLGTDPAPAGSRGTNYGGVGTGFSGFGTGGGPTRNNRTDIYPMFYDAGQYRNTTGAVAGNSYGDSAHEVPNADGFAWQEFDTNGDFGAPNIVVMKLEWDADGGKDVISLARFLQADTLDEAAFDALIAATPNLSSANWAEANKPDLTQGDLDTITFMGLKFFVDEIRLGTSFADIVGAPSLPADLTNNGFVDFQDLTILLANWNKEVTAAEGNLVEPLVTVVNFADLTTLLAAWTGSGPAGSPEAALITEAVPEPTSCVLALLGLLGLLGIRRRRNR
jgi:MYXO-CTERM domain-containing protein